MNTIAKLTILAAALMLLAACAGAAPQPVGLNIDMKEYGFTPNILEFQVGQEVTLSLTNSGVLEHEILFGREVMMENNRPAGYQEDMFAAGGETPEVTQSAMPESAPMAHEGFMVVLPPGATAEITFTMTEGMVGEWEMGCFSQEGVHFDAGMKGTVTVSQ